MFEAVLVPVLIGMLNSTSYGHNPAKTRILLTDTVLQVIRSIRRYLLPVIIIVISSFYRIPVNSSLISANANCLQTDQYKQEDSDVSSVHDAESCRTAHDQLHYKDGFAGQTTRLLTVTILSDIK